MKRCMIISKFTVQVMSYGIKQPCPPSTVMFTNTELYQQFLGPACAQDGVSANVRHLSMTKSRITTNNNVDDDKVSGQNFDMK